MKKKTYVRIVVILLILCAGLITGSVLTGIQYKKYSAKINDVEFLNIAFESIDNAYDMVEQCDFYRNLNHIMVGCSIGLVAVLLIVTLIYFLMKKMQESKKVTMYFAQPMNVAQPSEPVPPSNIPQSSNVAQPSDIIQVPSEPPMALQMDQNNAPNNNPNNNLNNNVSN